MKIYTKVGDKGNTSLLSGKKVPKYNERIEAYGTIDELNSFVGLLNSYEIGHDEKEFLLFIQNKLFNIGSELANDIVSNKIKKINDADILSIENAIDYIEKKLEPLNSFILPGGSTIVSTCHICRTICRRAERLCVKLNSIVEINYHLIIFLNRLSDYFFVLSRKLSMDFGTKEIIWNSEL